MKAMKSLLVAACLAVFCGGFLGCQLGSVKNNSYSQPMKPEIYSWIENVDDSSFKIQIFSSASNNLTGIFSDSNIVVYREITPYNRYLTGSGSGNIAISTEESKLNKMWISTFYCECMTGLTRIRLEFGIGEGIEIYGSELEWNPQNQLEPDFIGAGHRVYSWIFYSGLEIMAGAEMTNFELDVFSSTNTYITGISILDASPFIQKASIYKGDEKLSEIDIKEGRLNFSRPVFLNDSFSFRVDFLPQKERQKIFIELQLEAEDIKRIPVPVIGKVIFETMLDGTRELIASMSSFDPPKSTRVANSTNVTIGRLLLTAGKEEDIAVNSVRIPFGDNSFFPSGESNANVDLLNVKIYDGDRQIGATAAIIMDGTPDYVQFFGITDMVIPKGQMKFFDIKVGLANPGSNYCCGVDNGDVVGVGVESGIIVSSLGAGFSADIAIVSHGTLTATIDSSTPVTGNIAVGTTGIDDVETAKIRLASAWEPMRVRSLALTRGGGRDANFGKVSVWIGNNLTGESYVYNGHVTFNFPSAIEIPQDSYVVLSIKDEFNGIGEGTEHGDDPSWIVTDVSDIVAFGVISGRADVVDGENFPLVFLPQYLYKTTATISLNPELVKGGSSISGYCQSVLAIDITNNGPADLAISSIGLTPVFSGEIIGDAGIRLYWFSQQDAMIAEAKVGALLVSGEKIEFSSTEKTLYRLGRQKLLSFSRILRG